MCMTDTRRHSVLHFKVTGDSLFLINEVARYGSGIYHFNEPRQLAVSINRHIYVSDRYNNRIKVLEGNLHYIRHISHQSMTRPGDVRLTPDKVYVLCNSDAYFIHVFTHAGEKIESIIPHEYSPRVNFTNPYFLCIDNRGNFIIRACVRQIQIFSKEGKLFSTLRFHPKRRKVAKNAFLVECFSVYT